MPTTKRSLAWAAVAALAPAGCTSAPLAGPAAPTAREATSAVLTLQVAPPDLYGLLAVVRKWQPTDVFEYDVTLQRWNGSTFVGLVPALTVVVPRAAATRAVFMRLRQGTRYQASVVARGNTGGTAATTVLNATVPAAATFDMTAGQDVVDAPTASATVTLDTVPFDGAFKVVPANVPSSTKTFNFTLVRTDTSQTLVTASYAMGQTMNLAHVKAGVPYKLTLVALKSNGGTVGTATQTFSFDTAAATLEQNADMAVTF